MFLVVKLLFIVGHLGLLLNGYFPIFFTDVLSANNNYSCDFLNIGATQTAYLILHDDRPKGAPECCIIGQPFHPPPRNFSDNLYIKKASTIELD